MPGKRPIVSAHCGRAPRPALLACRVDAVQLLPCVYRPTNTTAPPTTIASYGAIRAFYLPNPPLPNPSCKSNIVCVKTREGADLNCDGAFSAANTLLLKANIDKIGDP